MYRWQFDFDRFQVPPCKSARAPAGSSLEDVPRAEAVLRPARAGRRGRTAPGRKQPQRAQSVYVEGHASQEVRLLLAAQGDTWSSLPVRDREKRICLSIWTDRL